MDRKALRIELDTKIQRMKEYARITHGYTNENFQYPVHVRRSHDGEKFRRSIPNGVSSDHQHQIRLSHPAPVLTPSCNDNRMSSHPNRPNHREQSTNNVFIVPPNKSVEDTFIETQRSNSLRKSSSSSTQSSPVVSSHRPHSIVTLLSTSTDDSQMNLLYNSSSSSSSSSTSTKSSKRRFLWKIFH